LWELNVHATTRVRIREVRIAQSSDAGDAAAEILRLTFYRGYTVSGSGGSTITPVNVSGHTGGLTAVTTVERNNTTQANTSGTLMFADGWNVQAPYLYLPAENDMRFVLEASSRFVVAITAPADAITMCGTITFEEFGFSI
jgi:hypothetical protein